MHLTFHPLIPDEFRRGLEHDRGVDSPSFCASTFRLLEDPQLVKHCFQPPSGTVPVIPSFIHRTETVRAHMSGSFSPDLAIMLALDGVGKDVWWDKLLGS